MGRTGPLWLGDKMVWHGLGVFWIGTSGAMLMGWLGVVGCSVGPDWHWSGAM